MLIRLLAFFAIFWIIGRVIRLFALGQRQRRSEIPATPLVQDPICGLYIEPQSAAHSIVTDDQTVYFCSERCAKEFQARTKPIDSGHSARAQK